MAKLDKIRLLTLIWPVCPENCEPLSIQWQGNFYIDLCHPFGLRSLSLPLALTSVISWPTPLSGSWRTTITFKTSCMKWITILRLVLQFFDVRPQCGNHPWCSFSSGHTLDPIQTCRTHHPFGFSKYPHLTCWIGIPPPDQQCYLHKYRSQNSSILRINNSKDFLKIHVYF